MANPELIWAESFDHYGTTGTDISNALDGAWSAIDSGISISSAQARTGTYSMLHTGGLYNGSRRARRSLGGARLEVGIAFGIYFPSLPSAADTNFVLSDISNNAILTFAWQTDGSIKVYHGDAEDTLIGTADAVLSAGSWNHFEVHAVISSTIGEVEVKVDTITVLHLTDLNLGSTGMSSVRWGSRHTGVATTSSSHYIDDIVCHDGSDFVGPARVLDVWPDADGSPFDWTVNGDTSGASAVSEVTPDDDDSYIVAVNQDDVAEFTMPELPADVEDIIGIYVPARMRQDEAGATTVEIKMLNGSSEESGGSNPLTTGWQYQPYIFQVDPALSPEGVWTKTTFEAAVMRLIRTE